MAGKVDLHTHTYFSDGALSPRELVMRAHEVGISILSVTDHDNIDGLESADAVAKDFGIEVVPGVELSSTLGTKDVHILGYLFDPSNKHLRETLEFLKKERFIRAERIVRKLNNLDLPLDFDLVVERAGYGAVGRPHIAAAMLDEGLTSEYAEAFEQYIGDSCPAFEPKYRISPEDAVDIIANAGGVSIVAHPGWYISESDLSYLIRAGIDGIEVVHPAHDQNRVRYYRGIASTYFLLESGGSDFHGGKRNDYQNFGTYSVTQDMVDAMKRRLFIQ
ncbi:MAG: PHP domain-containing protein [Bacteroidota bacterium]|jgi:predicted metal-dependent phosphoesterase TrpH|nr:PHP domain-containing protein [Bacteroidota bacterium]